MINLFKPFVSKPKISDSIKEYKNPKNYPLEVLQIHHEF